MNRWELWEVAKALGKKDQIVSFLFVINEWTLSRALQNLKE